jgi:hyperosmotically inducible protein
MERNIRFSLCATLLGAALALGGCAATDTQRSAGETIDDATLTAKVKTALIDNDIVEAGEVNVTSYRGVVQLSGFVDSNEEKTQATQAAKSVSGVKEVKNDLKVQGQETKVAERSAGDVVDDSGLTASVKTALIADEVTKGSQINVETRDGVVQLAGFVNTDAERDRATQVARSVSGVKDVRNDLEIKPKQ